MNKFRFSKKTEVKDSAGRGWFVSTISKGNRTFETIVNPITCVYTPDSGRFKEYRIYSFGIEEQLQRTYKPKHAKWMHKHLCEMYSQ